MILGLMIVQVVSANLLFALLTAYLRPGVPRRRHHVYRRRRHVRLGVQFHHRADELRRTTGRHDLPANDVREQTQMHCFVVSATRKQSPFLWVTILLIK